MTVAGLLSQTATVHVRDESGGDDMFGSDRPVWTAGATYPCRLEPLGTPEEVTVGGDVQTAEWRLYLPAAAHGNLSGYDRVTVAGEAPTFEVVGTPGAQRSPRGVHHVEARLRTTS